MTDYFFGLNISGEILMRICLFTPTFFPKMGGQEMVVDQLARHFTALGHDIVVLAQHGSRSGTNTEVTVPYRLERYKKPFSQFWGVGTMCRALDRLHEEWKFDIVHSHSCYPTGYAALIFCRKKNIPLIVTSHGGDLAEDSRFRSRPAVMKRSRQTLEQATAVTFISGYMEKSILDVAPDCAAHLHSISNGVDCATLSQKIKELPEIAKKHALQTDSFVLFLGRLHRRKGVNVLLQAFEQIARKFSETKLVIAGDGEESAPLRAIAEQSGFSSQIRFIGSVQGSDKMWLLQNALCLVLPTPTRETFGLVLLEAMANAKPVIGTKLGGIVDVIDDKKNGFLVQPGNADELAVAMEKLLSDARLREELGRNATAKAKQFDWPVVTQRYVALFDSLLQKKALSA